MSANLERSDRSRICEDMSIVYERALINKEDVQSKAGDWKFDDTVPARDTGNNLVCVCH